VIDVKFARRRRQGARTRQDVEDAEVVPIEHLIIFAQK